MKTDSLVRKLCALACLFGVILLVQHSVLASPGILTTPDLNVTSGANLEFELDGPGTPGIDYSQIVVTNSVAINDANLVLLLVGFTSTPGDMFEIINNQGPNPVAGTGFLGLPQGSIFSVSGDFFQISYKGGDGNDVVLTSRAAGVPDSDSTFTLLSLSLAALFSIARFYSLRFA
jgi:fibronectin-binding autotransporter adhesin